MMSRAVAVFGSSEPPDGDPEFERARRIGGLLARAGRTVVTGGYSGVMEGASRGAREAAGTAIGVTCRAFNGRSPNGWLSEVIEEDDLFTRTRRLIELSSAFIILPGRSGTLAEMTFLWALARAGLLGDKRIIVLGGGWPELVATLTTSGVLEPAVLGLTFVASSEEEAAALAIGSETV